MRPHDVFFYFSVKLKKRSLDGKEKRDVVS